ncbi:MAG: hypothetical protein ACJAQ4_001507, partial [Cryomorphaceae bacterium]
HKKSLQEAGYIFRCCTNGQLFSSRLKEVHHQIFCTVFVIIELQN